MGTSSERKNIIGPTEFGFCTCALERHERLPLRVLRVTGHGFRVDDEAIGDGLRFFDAVLEQNVPFSVIWDVRACSVRGLPTREQVKRTQQWTNENGRELDEHMRSTVIILSGLAVRAVARVLIRLCKPRQPTTICSNEAEAIHFFASLEKGGASPSAWGESSRRGACGGSGSGSLHWRGKGAKTATIRVDPVESQSQALRSEAESE